MITGRRRGLFALFMFLCCAVFVTLCVWQVKRLQWKQDVLQAIEAELAIPEINPFEADDFAAVAEKRAHIRRGALQGTVALCRAVYLDNRAYDGKIGYNLLAPMTIDDGADGMPTLIYLNLGWQAKAAEIPACLDGDAENIALGGLLTLPRTNRFTFVGEMAPRHWMAANPQAIAAHDGLGDASPLLLVVDAVPDSLKSRPLLAEIKPLNSATLMPPNNHRQYALFWGAMAAITAALTAYVLRLKA